MEAILPGFFYAKNNLEFWFLYHKFASLIMVFMKQGRLYRLFRYLLYKIGVTKGIPASVVNSIPIVECGEPLTDLKELLFLSFFDNLSDRKEVFARKSVAEKLEKAASMLPDSYHLKIHSAYRPRTEQIELWNRKFNEMKAEFPSLSEEEIVIKTKRICADPRFGFGGHQTGGAVDIALCDDNGNDYDMGTMISDKGSKIITRSKEISEEARRNRTILLTAMTEAGFVNYPKEWWHYCYGDRMWAAYKNRRSAFYNEVI